MLSTINKMEYGHGNEFIDVIHSFFSSFHSGVQPTRHQTLNSVEIVLVKIWEQTVEFAPPHLLICSLYSGLPARGPGIRAQNAYFTGVSAWND